MRFYIINIMSLNKIIPVTYGGGVEVEYKLGPRI